MVVPLLIALESSAVCLLNALKMMYYYYKPHFILFISVFIEMAVVFFFLLYESCCVCPFSLSLTQFTDSSTEWHVWYLFNVVAMSLLFC